MNPKPTSAQTRRADLETLSEWSKERDVDPRSLILLLKEIALTCIGKGYISDKVVVGSADGFVSVVERFPAVAVSAVGQIHRIQTDLQKELDKQPPSDPVINLIINRKRLEDTIE